MSKKSIFQIGDQVRLLPYDEVKLHNGIERAHWNRVHNADKALEISCIYEGRLIRFKRRSHWWPINSVGKDYIFAESNVPVEDLL